MTWWVGGQGDKSSQSLALSVPSRQNSAVAVNRVARAPFNRYEDAVPTLGLRLQTEPSEITDFGAGLHHSQEQKARRRKPRRPKARDGTVQSLQDRLFAALEPREDKSKDKGFFPLDLLPVLITEGTVAQELSRYLGDTHEPEVIAKYAEKICSERIARVNSSRLEDGQKKRVVTYRKIFATLVLIEKTSAMLKFLREGVNDSDLPLVRAHTGSYDLRRSRAPEQELKCFQSGWTPFQIRNFEDWQWTTLAPFFSQSKERKQVRHYPLQDRVILPFLCEGKRDDNSPIAEELLGGGGRVFKAVIHPDHHNFHRSLGCPRGSASQSDDGGDDDVPRCTCLFAIKRLHSQDKMNFRKEVDMLKKFSDNRDPHLISLLATYEQRRTYFLIFPRAEGDLQAYWQRTPAPALEDAETVRWVAMQCRGIAHGVLRIHEYESSNSRLHAANGVGGTIFGSHGDIKPENVLWFLDPPEIESHHGHRHSHSHHHSHGHGHDLSYGRGRGTLKLSDFGLADFNTHQTVSRKPLSEFAVTRGYRAPECDLPGHGASKGRQYDMWTLGCLYLEFVTWLIGGWALVHEFNRARMSIDVMWFDLPTDTFFQLEKDPETDKPHAIVKPSVTKFIEKLRAHPKCTPFVRDFLELIETGLLVVKNANPRVKDRFAIEEAHVWLQDMANKCKSWEYTCKPCNPQIQESQTQCLS